MLLWSLRPNPTPAVTSGSFGALGGAPAGGELCLLQPHVVTRNTSGGTTGACDGSFLFRVSHSFLAKAGVGSCEPLYLQWWYLEAQWARHGVQPARRPGT